MVPIGASSSSVSSCSPKPSCLIRGSVRWVPSSPVGPGRSRATLRRRRSLISSAARLVKVSSTTSPGSMPPHSRRSMRSEAGARIIPPCSLDGRSGWGRSLVARWSSAR